MILCSVSQCQDCFVSVVTAVNKEVLSGTDAVVISCQVTGITAELGTVKWTNSNGDDVTTSADASSYTVTDGSLESGNSQTTTLTVAAAKTTSDATYSCLITPKSPDDATEVSTSVTLNTYSKCEMLYLQVQKSWFSYFMISLKNGMISNYFIIFIVCCSVRRHEIV